MIRNIITAAILLTAFISMVSVAQIASAVEPILGYDVLPIEDRSANSDYPFAWTPDLAQQKRIHSEYQRLISPQNLERNSFSGAKNTERRLWSFEIYQGDGLHDLRMQSKHHNNLTLPDEDDSAYGVSVKQRF